MRLFPDDHETITGTARRLRSGETTCVEVLRSCLDRIDEKEHAVRAWVLVDRDGAALQAQALDAELRAGRDRGPLHGIPIGVKDIIDVKGLPTGCGCPRGTGQLALGDATIVSRLRDAGAVILGKTVTTAYAWIDPPVTRNPWNLDRTRRVVERLGGGRGLRHVPGCHRHADRRLDHPARRVLRRGRDEADVRAREHDRHPPVCSQPRSSRADRPLGGRPPD